MPLSKYEAYFPHGFPNVPFTWVKRWSLRGLKDGILSLGLERDRAC